MGEWGLGKRNERGSRLVEFCAEYNLVITNTWFKNHEIMLYTWKRPGDTGRFQIDFIMVRQRFRNKVLNCKTYSGADVDSDHNLLVMSSILKLNKLQKGRKIKRWDLDRLKKPEVVESCRGSISQRLTVTMESNTVEDDWVALRDEIVEAAEEQVGKKRRFSRNPWISQPILNLIDERRKYKNAANEEGERQYKRLRNETDRKCKIPKQKWLADKCNDIEA